MKKKDDFIKGMTSDKLSEVAKKASEPIKAKADKTEKRKMFRFGEKAHALAKTVAALENKSIQEYIDDLVTEDVKKRHPDLYAKLFGESKT